MATGNINIDPTIALGIKSPDSMTQLGNLLNVARGAQAYQQASQLNPIAVQAAQLELEKQQGLLQPTIRQAEAQAGTAELGLSSAQLNLAGGLLTGLEYSDAYKTGNIPELTSQLKTMRTILEANKVPVESTFGQITDMLKQGDIGGVRNMIQNLRTGLVSASEKFQAAQPQLTTSGGQPALFTAGGAKGGQISTPQYPGVNEPPQPPTTGAPAAPPALPPQAGQATSVPVQPPTNQQGKPLPPKPGVTAQDMTMPPEVAELNKPVAPQYPVRRPGAPGSTAPVLANEARDTEVNTAYKNSLISRQTELSTARRNIQETLKVAEELEGQNWFKTGAPADIERKTRQFFGEDRYKQLSKDLANIQISNIRAQGGSLDTVGGQQLMRLASGDETYPPKVLINIARRADADLTNIDLQASAAAKFSEKFGENNLNSFKQMWAKNADSKVFEAMNIFRDEKDPEIAKKKIDELLGKDPKQRKIFFQKYQNIQKLVQNGTLQ